MKKERVVVICPGRGTYTKETLGYLKKFKPQLNELIAVLDEQRHTLGQPTLSQLDDEPIFKPQLHTKGEHASALIFACAYADYLSLDFNKYEVVAVTGNSMGWYIAMAVAGAMNVPSAFTVINSMGSMMKDQIIGGQVIYPITDQQWQKDPATLQLVQTALQEVNEIPDCEAFISIHLGGYVVIGGNQKALDFILKKLPKNENYPFQLINHAAFHTPLLQATSEKAFQLLQPRLLQSPTLPLVDGRGHIWMDYAVDLNELYNYTFADQVTKPYDFSKAVSVCLKEFCPDRLILLGPGNSLGGAIGQILVENKWQNIKSKQDFSQRQQDDPFLISLGRSVNSGV